MSAVPAAASARSTATLTELHRQRQLRDQRFGGGILASVNWITLTGCTVSGNFAGDSGGGIRVADVATLTDSTVSGNRAGGSPAAA